MQRLLLKFFPTPVFLNYKHVAQKIFFYSWANFFYQDIKEADSTVGQSRRSSIYAKKIGLSWLQYPGNSGTFDVGDGVFAIFTPCKQFLLEVFSIY